MLNFWLNPFTHFCHEKKKIKLTPFTSSWNPIQTVNFECNSFCCCCYFFIHYTYNIATLGRVKFKLNNIHKDLRCHSYTNSRWQHELKLSVRVLVYCRNLQDTYDNVLNDLQNHKHGYFKLAYMVKNHFIVYFVCVSRVFLCGSLYV